MAPDPSYLVLPVAPDPYRLVDVTGDGACGPEEPSRSLQAIAFVLDRQPGFEVVAQAESARPPLHRVLVLSASLSKDNLLRACEAGADGVLDKTVSPEEIARTVRRPRSG